MPPQTSTNDNIVNIASMRFKPLALEANETGELTITLKLEPGIHGFIVLLKPMLPSIE